MASNVLAYPHPVSLQFPSEVNRPSVSRAAQSRFSEFLQVTSRVRSLGQALAEVPARLAVLPPPRFRVIVEGRERELRPDLREQIYRIGCEAIINAYRHSGAKEIEAVVEFRSSGVRVRVRDNGRGIDRDELKEARPGRCGLQGMRERAQQIGARLRVLSRAARGTEVELWAPGGLAFKQRAAPCA